MSISIVYAVVINNIEYHFSFYSVTGDKFISFPHKDFRNLLFPGIGEENFDGEERGEDLGELQGEDAGELPSESEIFLFLLSLNSLAWITPALRLLREITDCKQLMA